MERTEPVFLSGEKAPPQPLGRFLPPLPDQVFTDWLTDRIPPGSVILDPFGAAPRQCLEIAHRGYRLVTAANNPINRFLIETYAQPPSLADLQAALALLSSQRVTDQRLEPYIQSLYQTECDACDQQIIAQAFIWNRGENTPEARIYHCPACGHSGEFPATEQDRERARKIASTFELHKARALERVAALNDPDRSHVEEALSVYLPRAVLALFTIINKLDGLYGASEIQKNQLRALLLVTCDEANGLWAEDGSRPRPKQLTLPGRFLEKNVWLAMETAISLWSGNQQPVAITRSTTRIPELLQGGITLFDGPIRELSGQLSALNVQAVATVLPRPNQAFWTLSALWSGWLWGREAVGPFRSVLRRRRYDWNWHTAALYAALHSLQGVLPPHLPWFALIGEHEPGFLAAALTAGAAAGLKLDGLALREQTGQAQIHWQRSNSQTKIRLAAENTVDNLVQRSAREFLQQRGEPASFPLLHAAVMRAMAEEMVFPITEEQIAQGQSLTDINQVLQNNLSYQHHFLRYGGSAQTLETGAWWLRAPGEPQPPLADRLEVVLVNHLIRHPNREYQQLDHMACQEFAGLQTPEPELVEMIVNSYTEDDPEAPGGCRLRPEDYPQQRNQDIQDMHQTLQSIGQRLGYRTTGEQPLEWWDTDSNGKDAPAWLFYIRASANISRYLLNSSIPANRAVLVLPGGRANLVMYRLQRDPHLEGAYNKGWRFLKFRQVLRMAEDLSLDRDSFPEYLDIDPLTYTAPQMRLF